MKLKVESCLLSKSKIKECISFIECHSYVNQPPQVMFMFEIQQVCHGKPQQKQRQRRFMRCPLSRRQRQPRARIWNRDRPGFEAELSSSLAWEHECFLHRWSLTFSGLFLPLERQTLQNSRMIFQGGFFLEPPAQGLGGTLRWHPPHHSHAHRAVSHWEHLVSVSPVLIS